jgi:hypothetical protein
MRTVVRVLLALGVTYCAVVVIAVLFAFAITGWELVGVAVVLGLIALAVALRPRRPTPHR